MMSIMKAGSLNHVTDVPQSEEKLSRFQSIRNGLSEDLWVKDISVPLLIDLLSSISLYQFYCGIIILSDKLIATNKIF